jgi:hypothetical protein
MAAVGGALVWGVAQSTEVRGESAVGEPVARAERALTASSPASAVDCWSRLAREDMAADTGPDRSVTFSSPTSFRLSTSPSDGTALVSVEHPSLAVLFSLPFPPAPPVDATSPTPVPPSPPMPGPGLDAIPPPAACHQYTSTSAIPSGFGSPYDVLSSPFTNLMNVTCDVSSARVDLGKNDPMQYIYNTGYLFKTGGTAWSPISYTSTEALVAGAWYPKTATTNLSLTSTELANPNYVLGYICSWTGSGWKCGCRDSACTQSYWQIQSFKK